MRTQPATIAKWFMGGVVLALLAMTLSTCGGDENANSPATDEAPAAQDFSARGPYVVSATRLQLDADRPVEVLYPAADDPVPSDARPYEFPPDETWGRFLDLLPPGTIRTLEIPDAWFDLAPSAEGTFPLVVVSHGFGVERFTHADLGAHLASWGFVVALPEHPSRDLLALLGGEVDIDSWEGDADTILETIDLLVATSGAPGTALSGLVDADRVGVVGHSGGGHDAVEVAYDDRIDTWVGLAPAIPFPEGERGVVESERADGFDPGEFDLEAYLADTPPPDAPSMMVLAADDLRLAQPDRRLVFEWLPAPKRFVVLADTGHAAFLLGCDRIQAEGGSAVAEAAGFDEDSIERRVLENGCLPSDAPVEDVRATWNHLVVAQLREALGIEPAVAAASLEASYLDATFPDRIEEYVAELE